MLYIVLMVCAGCMIAMQSPINAALSRQAGPLEASLFSFLVGGLALFCAVLAFGKGSFFRAFEAPGWQWCGGLLGAALVFASILAVPRIGVLASVVAMILGNLALAAIIDNFGWFGAPVTPFTLRRLIGFCLVLAGLFFIFFKGSFTPFS